jgi:hypothetical protein
MSGAEIFEDDPVGGDHEIANWRRIDLSEQEPSGITVDVALTADVITEVELLPEIRLVAIRVRQSSGDQANSNDYLVQRLVETPTASRLLHDYAVALRAAERSSGDFVWDVECALSARAVIDLFELPPDRDDQWGVWATYMASGHAAARWLCDLPEDITDRSDHAVRRAVSNLVGVLRRDARPITLAVLNRLASSWPEFPDEDLASPDGTTLEDLLGAAALAGAGHRGGEDVDVSSEWERFGRKKEAVTHVDLDLSPLRRVGLADSDSLVVASPVGPTLDGWKLSLSLPAITARCYVALRREWTKALARPAEERTTPAVMRPLVVAYGALAAETWMPFSLETLKREIAAKEPFSPHMYDVVCTIDVGRLEAAFGLRERIEPSGTVTLEVAIPRSVPLTSAAVALDLSGAYSHTEDGPAGSILEYREISARSMLDRPQRVKLARLYERVSNFLGNYGSEAAVEAFEIEAGVRRTGAREGMRLSRELQLLVERVEDRERVVSERLRREAQAEHADAVEDLASDLWSLRTYLLGAPAGVADHPR